MILIFVPKTCTKFKPFLSLIFLLDISWIFPLLCIPAVTVLLQGPRMNILTKSGCLGLTTFLQSFTLPTGIFYSLDHMMPFHKPPQWLSIIQRVKCKPGICCLASFAVGLLHTFPLSSPTYILCCSDTNLSAVPRQDTLSGFCTFIIRFPLC